MEIKIVPILIDGQEVFKLRLNGVLYGVFWSHVEAMQYARNLPYSFENDLADYAR